SCRKLGDPRCSRPCTGRRKPGPPDKMGGHQWPSLGDAWRRVCKRNGRSVSPRRERACAARPMTIPFNRPGPDDASVRKALMQAFSAVLDEGDYIMGKELLAFEQEY